MDKKIISMDKALFWSLWLLAFLVQIATSPAVIAGGISIAIWIFTGTFWKDRGWLKQEWTLPVLLFMLMPWAGLIWTTNLHMGLKFAQRSYCCRLFRSGIWPCAYNREPYGYTGAVHTNGGVICRVYGAERTGIIITLKGVFPI